METDWVTVLGLDGPGAPGVGARAPADGAASRDVGGEVIGEVGGDVGGEDVPASSAQAGGVTPIDDTPLGLPRGADETVGAASASGSLDEVAGLVRTVGALVGVLVGIGVLAVVAKRLARGRGGLVMELGAGGRAPSGVLSVLGRYPVARGQTLVLLKLGTRIVLLSQATGGRSGAGGPAFSTLCEVTDAEEVAGILRSVDESSSVDGDRSFRAALEKLEATPRPHEYEVVDLTRRGRAAAGGERLGSRIGSSFGGGFGAKLAAGIGGVTGAGGRR